MKPAWPEQIISPHSGIACSELDSEIENCTGYKGFANF